MSTRPIYVGPSPIECVEHKNITVRGNVLTWWGRNVNVLYQWNKRSISFIDIAMHHPATHGDNIMKTDIRTKSVTVSGGKLPNDYKCTLNVTIDYTNVDRNELIERAMRADIVRVQNTDLRKRSTYDLDALKTSGIRYDANTIGSGVRSVDPITVLVNAGFTREHAEMIINNPTLAQQFVPNETTENDDETTE